MSQQQRLVQLSPASLALVFGKDEDGSRTAEGKHKAARASGSEIFADFKAQNMRSFWNKRLVKAMAEVYFQGWMENFVLIVQGNANHLEVLREAWMRRALRSPRGFNIRAVGDLSPLQMAPIAQSQFIPLSEVLCSVISDMNAANSTVTQEALLSHMTKAYPGMTIPTQDILYNALGALIKERKVYHTGEGYFIVTPQTYFITNSVVQEKQWWAEHDPPSPPPITYLVSSESCMDSTAERPTVAHCKSCSCFAPSVLDQNSVNESTAKSLANDIAARSLKGPRELKPSIQHQATSTAPHHYQPSETSKSTVSRKDKERVGRRFGLSFFRRNVGRKDKPRKEYATFSGQFPPAEWPVRDEDDMNNLPRDLEHAIIKRINPDLTVDNLVRHTVLMKQLEGKGVDRGVSTEILASEQRRHSGKALGKKSSSRAARSKRRGRSSGEKLRGKERGLGSSVDPELDQVPSLLTSEVPLDEPVPPACEHSTADPKNVFKKRIDNPFHGRTARDGMQRKLEESRQTGESWEHVGYRSKSWDPSRTKKSSCKTGRAATTNKGSCEALALDTSPVKELPADYGCGYPESSTLRIEDKMKLTESKVRGRSVKESQEKESKRKVSQEADSETRVPKHSARHIKDSDHPARPHQPQITHRSSTAASAFGPNTATQRRLSLCAHQADGEEDLMHMRPSHASTHQHTARMLQSSAVRTDSVLAENDGSTDEDQTLYMRDVDDDDACSSLYLHEDECSELSQSDRTPHHQSSLDRDEVSTTVEEDGVHQGPVLGPNQQLDCRRHEQSSQQPFWQCLSAIVPAPWPEMSGGSGEAAQSSQASEGDSDAETLHRSADEAESRSFSWSCSQGVEEQEVQRFGSSHVPSTASQSVPATATAGEAVENHSSTGDSGIDSPRTGPCLPSGVTDGGDAVKQRGFLQDLERLQAMHSQNPLLQLTPTMNV